MSDNSLKRVCLYDEALAASITAMAREELEKLAGSMIATGRYLARSPQPLPGRGIPPPVLGAYARKIFERAQTSMLSTLAPLDDTVLSLIEENADLALSEKDDGKSV